MPDSSPEGKVDRRFGNPEAEPTAWSDVVQLLERAELYWLSTVRADGRPHVTPLIGLWHEGTMYFTTGLGEQKAHNLERHPQVALTTGTNRWAAGLDAVVEGTAVQVTDHEALAAISDAYVAKYGEEWRFEVGDGVFGSGERAAALFRIDPTKVLAFAKEPHTQTTFLV